MYCNHCGAPVDGQNVFCPNCGAPLSNGAAPENGFAPNPDTAPNGGFAPGGPTPAGSRLFAVIRDEFFLALCILLTVSAGLSVLSASLPILTILAAIFLWMLYSAGKRGQLAVVQFKNLSGTATAAYVLLWVAVGFLALGIALLLLFLPALKANDISLAALWSRISDAFDSLMPSFPAELLSRYLLLVLFVVLIFGAISAVISLLATRTLRLFLRSVSQSAETGVPAFVKCEKARVWLIVLGVFSGIAAVSSLSGGQFFSALASGSMCAAEILGAMLIKKYFADQI
ncbi:MAG: zinc-ribbon domain-containing protein [Clostridia bacterium]|nr:zinc-ribbon domain-containing protein [Clostridia bacterium]